MKLRVILIIIGYLLLTGCNASNSTLSGVPDGEYVVTTFEASFAQKKNAIETVTVVLSGSGKWKVVGYFIK